MSVRPAWLRRGQALCSGFRSRAMFKSICVRSPCTRLIVTYLCPAEKVRHVSHPPDSKQCTEFLHPTIQPVTFSSPDGNTVIHWPSSTACSCNSSSEANSSEEIWQASRITPGAISASYASFQRAAHKHQRSPGTRPGNRVPKPSDNSRDDAGARAAAPATLSRRVSIPYNSNNYGSPTLSISTTCCCMSRTCCARTPRSAASSMPSTNTFWSTSIKIRTWLNMRSSERCRSTIPIWWSLAMASTA